MLYLLVTDYPADYTFITNNCGPMILSEGLRTQTKINNRMAELGGLARFYLSPILDI